MSDALFRLAELSAPLFKGNDSTPLTMHDPSTMELAMLGLATLAAYWLGKRWLTSGGAAVIETQSAEGKAASFDRAQEEETRGAA